MIDSKVQNEIIERIFDVLSNYKLTLFDIENIIRGIRSRAEGSYYLEIKNTSEN
ncbi:MAG: hypothetical protein ACI4JM_08325 [Oscillospiraceae bacterium]